MDRRIVRAIDGDGDAGRIGPSVPIRKGVCERVRIGIADAKRLELPVRIVGERSIGVERQKRSGRECDLASDVARRAVHRADAERGAIHVDIGAGTIIGEYVPIERAVLPYGDGVVFRIRRIVLSVHRELENSRAAARAVGIRRGYSDVDRRRVGSA